MGKGIRTPQTDWQKKLGHYGPMVFAALAIATVGTILITSSHAATPTTSLETELNSPAGMVNDSTASGGKAVKFQAASAIPAAGSYVRPGTVGYLGNTSALTVYQPGGAAAPGCNWQSYGMRCDTDNLTLDHVWLKGSLYWNGAGKLTFSNSIIEGGAAAGNMWGGILSHNAGATQVVVKDSTLRWSPTYAYDNEGGDVGPIWIFAGDPGLDVERNDISGYPQGIDPGGNSIIDSNYIHDIRTVACPSSTAGDPYCHKDGIFSQGGSHILIQRNYIDMPGGISITAAIFFQSDSVDTDVKVYANYIAATPYYNMRNQSVNGLDGRNNTFGTHLPAIDEGAAVTSIWTGNTYLDDGSAVPHP